MRESRSSGSVEGVMGNHDSYSDSRAFYCALFPASSRIAPGLWVLRAVSPVLVKVEPERIERSV